MAKVAEKLSTKEISKDLVEEIVDSIKGVNGWGSVEIFVQDYCVTQVTEKRIKKPVKSEK